MPVEGRIVMQCLGTVLRPLGFSRRHRICERKLPEILQICQLQIAEGNMTVNLGLYSDAIRLQLPQYHSHMKVGKSVGLSDCQVRFRVSELLPWCKDVWWRPDSEVDARSVGTEIASVVLEYAVPFFEEYQTVADILRFYDSQGPNEVGPIAEAAFHASVKRIVAEQSV